MKVCALASGSKGNSIFIKSANTKILIDAGISTKQIALRLKELGEDLNDIDGIFITHEHVDHIYALKVISKRFNIPIFISKFSYSESLKEVKNIEHFLSGDTIKFKDLNISTFQIPHDAEDPVGFIIESGESRVGIATDIGKPTYIVKNALKNCSTIFLEFNHDEELLMTGKYPWHLKQRIRSNYGHLSNREAVEMIKEINSESLQNIFISHVSEENNSMDRIKYEIYESLQDVIKDKNFYFTFQSKISNYVTV